MKKLFALVAVLLLTATLSFAEGINLGDFPKGKWLDPNWNGVWEFGTNSIRLLDTNGAVIFDFADKITDFKLDVGVSGAKVSFTCKEAERKYVFTKGVTNLDLTLDIDPDWTDTNYKVTMKMQK